MFLACFHDWRQYLGLGERGTVMIVARDRKQARVIKHFITGLLHEVKMLRATIEDESAETISLKNRVSIEIHTASFRSTRGYTIIAALLDEIAYWPTDDAAYPDTEVVNAIRPGMATIPSAMLLCASSPHARKGALWDAYRKHFGNDGDEVLVWQADTRSMNAVVRQSYIDKHIAEDPARAAAEYGAQFRVDIENFVSRETIDTVVVIGRHELPRIDGIHYVAFVDPSGGSADSMTLAIAHVEGGNRAVVDVICERKPPFSPDGVVSEFATCSRLTALRPCGATDTRASGRASVLVFTGSTTLRPPSRRAIFIATCFLSLTAAAPSCSTTPGSRPSSSALSAAPRAAAATASTIRLVRTTTSPMPSPAPSSLRFSRRCRRCR